MKKERIKKEMERLKEKFEIWQDDKWLSSRERLLIEHWLLALRRSFMHAGAYQVLRSSLSAVFCFIQYISNMTTLALYPTSYIYVWPSACTGMACSWEWIRVSTSKENGRLLTLDWEQVVAPRESLSISEICSQVRVKRSVRLTGGLLQSQQSCGKYTELLWWSKSWAAGQRFQSSHSYVPTLFCGTLDSHQNEFLWVRSTPWIDHFIHFINHFIRIHLIYICLLP